MPHTWTQALDAYRYPVNLADFVDSEKFPGWFQFNTQSGDRDTTVAFEYHFRQYAREAIEPWLEVIYWKLYSQPGRRNRLTRQVANHFVHEGTTPTMLSEAWLRYTEKPTCANFDAFRRLFGFAQDLRK